MNASQVLMRWQYQKFNDDYDKYFLIMSKRFRNIYPYSIYVLNNSALRIQHAFFRLLEKKQSQSQNKKHGSQIFSFSQSHIQNFYQQSNEIQSRNSLTQKQQNQQHYKTQVSAQNQQSLNHSQKSLRNNNKHPLNKDLIRISQEKQISSLKKGIGHQQNSKQEQQHVDKSGISQTSKQQQQQFEQQSYGNQSQTNNTSNRMTMMQEYRSQSPNAFLVDNRGRTPNRDERVQTIKNGNQVSKKKKSSSKKRKLAKTQSTFNGNFTMSSSKQYPSNHQNMIQNEKSRNNSQKRQGNLYRTQIAPTMEKGWKKMEFETVNGLINDALNYHLNRKFRERSQHDHDQESEFTIDLDKLQRLKVQQEKRRQNLMVQQQYQEKKQQNFQLSKTLTHTKSQILTSENQLIPNNTHSKCRHQHIDDDKSHSSQSRSRSPPRKQFVIKPTTINHFTGKPLEEQPRDYTPTKSTTLFKKTFAKQQKEREKDQQFLDQYHQAVESIKYHKMAQDVSPNVIRNMVKNHSSQNELGNQILTLIDKDSTNKISKDLLIKTQSMLERSKSPHQNQEYIANSRQQQSQNYYESPEVYNSKPVNINTHVLKNRYNYKYDTTSSPTRKSPHKESEFSFQRTSSEEKSAERYQQYKQQTYHQQDYSPMKTTNPISTIRRTRAQRLKNPENDKNSPDYSKHGGTSAQKRASEIMAGVSPRVKELKNSAYHSKRSSKMNSRSHSKKSSSFRAEKCMHFSHNVEMHIEDEDEIAIATAKQFQNRQLQNIIRDTQIMNNKESLEYLDSYFLMTDSNQGTHRTHGSKDIDEGKRDEELRIQEEIRKLKQKYQSSESNRYRSKSGHKKKSSLNRSGQKQLNQNHITENDILMSKYNQEKAEQLYRNHLANQKTVPKIRTQKH
ncbi:UNKNOWN [Stylonychia lemnae]|uniref:Uncharacterized protein n=1 Tax=Stylonychia lemnae TaxID=5949 RepID=A0A077ZWP2_STYLE|nr:UNKNOWN [Stylonychia lemnae]|eukprot:CDW74315.1 UNKNOWN [Stylonychia lemnae]